MILAWKKFCTCLMMMDLCTDLMGSGSWILTMISVFWAVLVIWPPDLCFQPARTIVPGVSCQLSIINYFVIIELLTSADKLNVFLHLRKYFSRHQQIIVK